MGTTMMSQRATSGIRIRAKPDLNESMGIPKSAVK
jgi:hypothetical protein